MPKKTQKIRNVIVAVNLADASWRDFLTGFFDYARTGVHWNIRLLQSSEELAREAGDLVRADGIVSGIRADDATAAAFSATKVPLVLVGMEDERLTRRTGTTVIRNDNEDIGAFAARHFLSLGRFNSFGFVTTNTDEPWSALRAQGFQRILDADGLDLHQFRTNFVPGSSEDLARLVRWVRELPKPAAIFAAYDRRAIHVLSACKDAGLSVPGQVAVIGVDNDRLLCDFADPPLSSIAPDHEEEGRIAAQTLDAIEVLLIRLFVKFTENRIELRIDDLELLRVHVLNSSLGAVVLRRQGEIISNLRPKEFRYGIMQETSNPSLLRLRNHRIKD